MTQHDHRYFHALGSVHGIGTQSIRRLLEHFGSAKASWHGTETDYKEVGLSTNAIASLRDKQKTFDPEKSWSALEKDSITLILESDANFPKLLQKIPHPPLMLYVRGNKKILDEMNVAIVGSRKFSPYGKQAATRLAYDLSSAGIHIISGLALGIDAIAHHSTINTQVSGKTIAVLGGSIDDASITPRTHVALAHDIIAHGGALISEYAPPTAPNKGTFPARNRIMAGMSHATLIIEAGEKSGTLITAEYATSFARPLFAVPGSIFAQQSVGTNTLIASGTARTVQNAHDVLTVIGTNIKNTPSPQQTIPTNPDEKKIYKILQKYPDGLTIDKIITHTTLKGATITSALVLMELDGSVNDLGGGRYAIL